ncbi:hypothetical protein [Alkalicoccus daliensis]|uniref:Uncharacterized protein n=1 Tax=Alkalicoccus daliensis TaxID=745820 RepID=A0A1H0GJU1_9BACI|nr:hypothetical protein [Alkalicoccus daliensis]SDO07255.1 hypothetical protein SAMN04488053_106141 [Alkalicoccus daliensis]
MKKKMMITAMTSMFAIGTLAACGDMEGNEINNEPMEEPAENTTENNDTDAEL